MYNIFKVIVFLERRLVTCVVTSIKMKTLWKIDIKVLGIIHLALSSWFLKSYSRFLLSFIRTFQGILISKWNVAILERTLFFHQDQLFLKGKNVFWNSIMLQVLCLLPEKSYSFWCYFEKHREYLLYNQWSE